MSYKEEFLRDKDKIQLIVIEAEIIQSAEIILIDRFKWINTNKKSHRVIS